MSEVSLIASIMAGFNAVDGSDSDENSKKEIAFFFGADGVCPRTR